MHIQAIAFDMDDTLLREDATISPYTLSVLRQAADRGIHIIPASGRTSASMRAQVEQIGCASGYICCNGAQVRTTSHQVLTQELLPAGLAQEIASWAKEKDAYAHVYDETCFYYTKECGYAQAYQRSTGMACRHVPDLPAFITTPTPKLLVIDAPERIPSLMAQAQALWGKVAAITCSKPYFLEFNPKEATKGNALRWCAAHWGFSMAHVLAFGDSLNDLSMLEAAGHGVAMGNARADVKARIPTTCLTNQQDGVAHYIHQHVLHAAKEEQA